MNFTIEEKATARTVERRINEAEPAVSYAAGEKLKTPSAPLLKAARAAAIDAAKAIGGPVSVEIQGHQSKTKGRGHDPVHLSIAVSSLSPKAAKEIDGKGS